MEAEGEGDTAGLYDRVLVDAQCTHDGSLRHLAKHGQQDWAAFQRQVLVSEEHVHGMVDLQRRLLLNGFRLLRPGGTLVYATCSFMRAQNEEVVEWLLAREPDASVVPTGLLHPTDRDAVACVPDAGWLWERAVRSPSPPCREGGLPNTVRFDPITSGTSGLFIARLMKRDSNPRESERGGGEG